MKISNIISDNFKVGYLIEDGDIRYSIPLDGVIHKSFYPLLEQEGYILVTEDRTNIDIIDKHSMDIESIDISLLSEEEAEGLQMEYTKSTLLDVNDIVKVVGSNESDSLAPTGPVNRSRKAEVIKAKEDLLKLLEFPYNANDNLRKHNINAFCSDDALFGVEEFVGEKFEVRSLLGKYMNMGIAQFTAMLMNLKEDGLIDENSSSAEVLKAFFSYGVPMLKEEIIDIEILNGAQVEGYHMDRRPVSIVGEVGTDAIINHQLSTEPNYRIDETDTSFLKFGHTINNVFEEILRINTVNYTIIVQPKILEIYNKHGKLKSRQPNIRPKVFGDVSLRYEHYNLLNENIQKEVKEELFKLSLAESLSYKAKPSGGLSSYEVLRRAPLTLIGIFKYLISQETIQKGNKSEDIDAVSYEESMKLYIEKVEVAKNLLMNMTMRDGMLVLDEDLDLEEFSSKENISALEISTYLNDFILGNINIDETFKVLNASTKEVAETFKEFQDVTTSYLGLDVEEVARMLVDYYNNDFEGEIVAEGKDAKIRLRLELDKNKLSKANIADYLEYTSLANTPIWLYVDEAYTAQAQEAHVAMRYRLWKRSNEGRKIQRVEFIERNISEQIYDQILNMDVPDEFKSIVKSKKSLESVVLRKTADIIFSIDMGQYGNKMETHETESGLSINKRVIESSVFGKPIQVRVSEIDCATIKKTVGRYTDTLATICETNSSALGISRAFVNARVSQDMIKPLEGYTIAERPAGPLFYSRILIPSVGIRSQFVDKGYFRNPKTGKDEINFDSSPVSYFKDFTNKKHFLVTHYATEVVKNIIDSAKRQKVDKLFGVYMPLEIEYPKLNKREISRPLGPGEVFDYGIKEPRMIDHTTYRAGMASLEAPKKAEEGRRLFYTLPIEAFELNSKDDIVDFLTKEGERISKILDNGLVSTSLDIIKTCEDVIKYNVVHLKVNGGLLVNTAESFVKVME